MRDTDNTIPLPVNKGAVEPTNVVILPALSAEFNEPLSATMAAYREKADERPSPSFVVDPYGRSADA